MAKNFEMSETGNWNIADKYSEMMIFKSLYECSENLKIAKFGCSDILEDFTITEEVKIQAKIKALRWAKESLERLIKRSLFAIKKIDDKTKMQNHLEDLKKI